MHLAIHFDIRGDEEVEGFTLLRRIQANVAALAQGHSILVVSAEEVWGNQAGVDGNRTHRAPFQTPHWV